MTVTKFDWVMATSLNAVVWLLFATFGLCLAHHLWAEAAVVFCIGAFAGTVVLNCTVNVAKARGF